MKHAYLIIAHNEFDILRLLVESLDDARNDIFVHIDKKVRRLPKLSCQHSRLFVLENRVDVRWGHVSQIACELRLFEEAQKRGAYDYYHLISGTHFPLKSNDEMHTFFERSGDRCIFSNLKKSEGGVQEMLKMHRVNLFLRYYASSIRSLSLISQFLWKTVIALQRIAKITINDEVQFYWANNWCSLTHNAVEYLCSQKKHIMHRYRWSFCGDEWFVPTELMDSPFRAQVSKSDNLLYGIIGNANSEVLSIKNLEDIEISDCLFCRKVLWQEKELVDYLVKRYERNRTE